MEISQEDLEVLSEFDSRLRDIYKEKFLNGGVPHNMNHLKTIYDKYGPKKQDCCGGSGKWLQRLAFYYVNQPIKTEEPKIEEPKTIKEITNANPRRKRQTK